MTEPDSIRRDRALPFEIELLDGSRLVTVGDAQAYLLDLSHEQHQKPHWVVAIRMFGHAVREPAYLKAATVSLQTALALDRLLLSLKN